MTVKLVVLTENRPHEKRVALVPQVAEKLSALGIQIWLQQDAGIASRIPNQAYLDAKASPAVQLSADIPALLSNAQIVIAVQPPSAELLQQMTPGTILLSFVYAQREPELVKQMRDLQLTCFAMELVPRISRAQAMDALSSQAALAGYYGALLGATQLARILPMMTTAVGSIRPAKCLVMGLGVAGLQALATARRLGAVTEGYDVRPDTKEQAESLGAKFVDTGVDGRGEGGYARELSSEEQQKIQAVLTKHIQQADLIITTAAIPGRPSPKLISKAQVDGMKNGAVIVDLAADGGGNCEYSVPGETIQTGHITIAAPFNVPSLLAEHASELYAKNLLNLIGLFVKDGFIDLDWDDEILAKTVLTHQGEIKNAAAKTMVEG
jgi:H+-translocating NAD(P) transhydrogenase subunit alpha